LTIWALVSGLMATPLFTSRATICWPLASCTMFARVRLRKARLRRRSSNGIESRAPNVLGGRFLSGSVSRVSTRIARLTPLPGAARAGRPPSAKSNIRRQSVSQLLSSRSSPPRSPPRPEKMNIAGTSVGAAFGSTSTRPFFHTLSSVAGRQIRGR
jgi:hypothetical protein